MAVSVILYLDSILVPLSVFFTIGYHAYLLHNVKHRPLLTSIGFNALKRRAWIQQLNHGDDKKGMLVVQSLRNTLMYAILTATVTALILLSLAAITNNAFKANRTLFAAADAYLFGSQTSRILVLKYGSASIFLIASFLCSSVAVGSLVDANFLMNAIGDFAPSIVGGGGGSYTETVAERGFAMAVVGNRLLCVAVTLLMWMVGPLAVVVSSLALVWGLHHLDFVPKLCVK